jgi:hypothetical protein
MEEGNMTTREPRLTRGLYALMLAMAALAGAACDDDSPLAPETGAVYLIAVGQDLFRVRVTEPEALAVFEARRTSGQIGVVAGTLAAGDGGFNAPWSWHLEPSTVHAPDVTIGTCSGTPAGVEQDLEYWLNQVGDFCPVEAQIIAVLE